MPNHFLTPEPGDGLRDEGRRRGPDVLDGHRIQERKLRPEPAEEALVVLRDPAALRPDREDLGQDLGQRDQALHRARGRRWRDLLRPVREVLDPVHHPDRQRLPAHRAQALVLAGLVRGEADLAAPVAVQVVLALLGKELERASVPLARLQGAAKGEVVEVGIEYAHLPAELLR